MADIEKEVEERLNLMLEKMNQLKVQEFINKALFEPSVHLLKHPGKLLRPRLVFVGSYFAPSKADFTNLALAIELLHVSSLIHDDIIDKSPNRRGVDAVHVAFGEEAALLAGDALIAKAISFASQYGKDVLDKIADTALSMCAGELLDSRLKSVTLDEYLKIARLKSASLIGISLSIPAVFSKDAIADRLYEIGSAAGIAFQIRDDVLDFLEGDEEKGIMSAISKKRITKPEEVKAAIKLNKKYVGSALKMLDDLPDGEAKKLLAGYISAIELSDSSL